MNLRQRLFFLVSILFVITFVLSTFLESYLTRSYLLEEKKEVTAEIVNENDTKLKHLEEFLSKLLMEAEANLDAVLQRISQHTVYKRTFERDLSWHGVSVLLMTNKWIDFIQSVNDGKVSAGVMVRNDFLDNAFQIQVEKGIALYFTQDSEGNWQGPLVGLKLDITAVGGESINPHFWVLFDMSSILNFKQSQAELFTHVKKELSFPPFFSEKEQFDFQKSFFERIQDAKEFFKANPELIPKAPFKTQDYLNRLLKKYHKSLPEEEKETAFQKVLEHNKDRFMEIEMIWNMSVIFLTPPSLANVIGVNNPIGMVAQHEHEKFGKVILNKEVLFRKPYFDVTKCLEKFKKDPGQICHDRSMSVVYLPERDRIFFVNALDLSESNAKELSYLTVGVDGALLLQKLALATHATTVFVSENKVMKAFSGDGKEIKGLGWKDLPLEKILPNQSGVITFENTEYFYLHLKPIEKSDFHFFLFLPKKQEFALVDTLNKSVQDMTRKLSIHMRFAAIGALILVLFFLNRIAKKITEPITALAKATGSVEKGRYDEIDLPSIKKKRKDEISMLYHSFTEMVEGLKEKEKVRAVLNKVVSPDIAEEILKGKVHLGGEEKNVTVLFADIRNFTGLTQNMAPSRVIELLNKCMTVVSVVIDEHGGVIDKYAGDEVMALFGAPVEKPDSANKAVSCGLDILRALELWNQEREKEKLPHICMGIGIHTGLVVAGNMGAENRLNYTVLGANVNLASRLCSIAKPMEVLISESTFNDPSVKDQFNVEKLSDVALKGFTKTITAFRVK